jgi:uncharacterized protein YlxW (UPF0749 family)
LEKTKEKINEKKEKIKKLKKSNFEKKEKKKEEKLAKKNNTINYYHNLQCFMYDQYSNKLATCIYKVKKKSMHAGMTWTHGIGILTLVFKRKTQSTSTFNHFISRIWR